MNILAAIIESYESNFKVALAIWPVISTFLTLPLLAYLYHRNGRLSIGSILAAYLSVLYILGLGCFTLYPLPSGDSGPGITYGLEPQLIPLMCVADVFKDGLAALFQIIANIALFVPLGFICGRFLKLNLRISLVIGFCISLLIEITQLTGIFGIYPYSYRTFDVDDLFNNTIGALFGYLLAKLVSKYLPQESDAPSITLRPGFIRRCVSFWIDMCIVIIPTAILSVTSLLLVSMQSALMGEDGSISEKMTISLGIITFIFMVVLFVWVEAAFPWQHGGQTPGGSFVHMTFETKQRTGGIRILFYASRILTIALAFAFPALALPFLGIFYLFARQMPYDYIAGQAI